MNPTKKRKQPEGSISLDMTSTGNGLDEAAVYLQNEHDSEEEDDVDEEEEQEDEQDGEEEEEEEQEQEQEQEGEEVEEIENKENIKPRFQRETRSGWKPNKKKLKKASSPSPPLFKRPKSLFSSSKVSKSDLKSDPKVKLLKEKYKIKYYERVRVDNELDVEVQQWNNNDVIIFTRKSPGYEEFASIQSITIAEPLMNGLRFIKRRKQKSLKDLANAPIEIKIGEGVYLRLITTLSTLGNHYRSLRIETLKKRISGPQQHDSEEKNAVFYMKFTHVEPLLAALQAIFTPK